MKNFGKVFLAFILTSILSLSANAQKLPGTQKQSIRAPKNVKIDGKALEWGDNLQAYNHATQVYYTVANDDKRLYLVIKTDKREIINKIINGGVSLSVKTDGKKTMKDGPTITYPVFNWRNHPNINLEAMSELKMGEKESEKKMDSLLTIGNASLEEKAKFIRVTGVKDVDTLISVYNTDGIKARSAFDSKMNYVVEMAIDLKLFGLSNGDVAAFNYNIMLNGIQLDHIPGINVSRDDSGTITSIDINSTIANKYTGSQLPTDCWGSYTLAK